MAQRFNIMFKPLFRTLRAEWNSWKHVNLALRYIYVCHIYLPIFSKNELGSFISAADPALSSASKMVARSAKNSFFEKGMFGN